MFFQVSTNKLSQNPYTLLCMHLRLGNLHWMCKPDRSCNSRAPKCLSSSPLTTSDVLIVDFDVIISVRSALFMPPSKGVENFMDYNSSVLTPTAYGDLLPSSTSSSHIRITPVEKKKMVARKPINSIPGLLPWMEMHNR